MGRILNYLDNNMSREKCKNAAYYNNNNNKKKNNKLHLIPR